MAKANTHNIKPSPSKRDIAKYPIVQYTFVLLACATLLPLASIVALADKLGLLGD
jgi:hypothetical protein